MSDFAIEKYERNTKNPFVEKAIDEINNHIVKKYRNSSGQDQKAILQAINPDTGEMLGHTTFIRQIEVDEDKFTKVYLSQFSAFWDLGKQGIKVFGYIMTKLIIGQDLFIFLLDECLEYTDYKSKSSIFIGIGQLLQTEIIARGPAENLYFINPLVAFNGNRVTYANTYVKKRKGDKEHENQLHIFSPPSVEADKDSTEAKSEWE
jgi:intergrase/recombinase